MLIEAHTFTIYYSSICALLRYFTQGFIHVYKDNLKIIYSFNKLIYSPFERFTLRFGTKPAQVPSARRRRRWKQTQSSAQPSRVTPGSWPPPEPPSPGGTRSRAVSDAGRLLSELMSNSAYLANCILKPLVQGLKLYETHIFWMLSSTFWNRCCDKKS